MKKIFVALTLVAFLGGTSFAFSPVDGDPVKTEKTKGDEKKKKKKKKKEAKTTCTKSTQKSCCSKSSNKTCTKKKEL
ncbi:MAG TPA: hypothetical protein DCF89_00610 [Flavobacteriales bacterium]|nr:hypothetical protein [Crocinitomicaceae bacterium]HAE29584.1 hypothetical protein [Flavobacteriales bacterium]|tara:strand:- start:1495 stop:1725 length:231 start_codon:yes stop_codon:yes gene_type:complete